MTALTWAPEQPQSAPAGDHRPAQKKRRDSYFQLVMQVASTFFNKPASSFHSAKAKKPKKYVLQSAEFYGADFSLPPENPELENLHRPPPDSQTTSELDRIRAEQGSVFISALNSIIFNRSERASVPSTDSPDPAAGSPSSPQQPESSQFVPKPLASVLNPAQQQPVDYSELFPPFIAKTEGVSIFRIESLKPALQSDSTFGKFCTADCYIILNATRQDGADADVDMDDHDYDYKIFSWIGNQAELDKRFCAAMFAVGLRNWIGTSETVERETDSDESESFLDLFGDNFEILDASYATDSGLYVTEKRRYPTRLYRVQGKAQVVLQLVEPSSRSLRSDGVFLLDVGYALYQWNGSKSSLQHKSKCRIMVDRISKSERAGKVEPIEIDESDEPSRFWSILGGERTQDEDQDVDEEHAEFVTLYQSSDISPALYRATEELADEVEGHTVTAGKMKRAMLESEGCYILDTGVELNLWIGKLATLALKSSATELLTRIVPVRKRPKWVALNKHWEGHETEVFKLWFVDWDDKLDINWEDVKQGDIPKKLAPTTKPPSPLRVDVRALYEPPPDFDVSEPVIEETMGHANGLLRSLTAFIYRGNRFVRLPEEERGHFYAEDSYIFLCVYRLEELKEKIEREEKRDRRLSVRSAATSKSRSSVIMEPSGSERPSHASRLHLQIPVANSSSSSSSSKRTSILTPTLEESEESKFSPVSGELPSPRSEVDDDEPEEHEEHDESEDESRVECVVYFWKGIRSSAIAMSTFKFKTQKEMEALVMDMYKCSVKVVYLDQGKEPLALLAHLDNMYVVHQRGQRGQDRDRKSALYHIWTDNRYKTTRAVQVASRAASLVSRDCFFLYSLDTNTPSYLWIGKGASKDEVRRAHAVIARILKVRPPNPGAVPSFKTQQSLVSAMSTLLSPTLRAATLPTTPTDGLAFESLQHPLTALDILSLPYKVINERLELHGFWSLLQHGRERYAGGSEYYYIKPPRFLKCSCTSGFFSVEELIQITQVDLTPDSCVILDPGAPNKIFIWKGAEASDVVCKLTWKSVEVWLDNLDDGRAILPQITSDDDDEPRRPSGSYQQRGSDVVWVNQANEPIEFRAFFRGWDIQAVGFRMIEVGSEFSRMEEEKRRQKALMRMEAATDVRS